MTQTVLLTLGRLPKALDLARALHRAGRRVVIAEPFGWHLSRTSRSVARCYRVTPPVQDPERYVRDLLDVVAREQVSSIVCVSEETMHAAALKQYLPNGIALFAMDQHVLIELHDKLHFQELCQHVGLGVPQTALAGDAEALRLVEAGDCIVKPRRSSAGAGVLKLKRGGPLPLERNGLIVQTFLDGPLISSFTIAHHGRVLGTIAYRAVVLAGTVAVCFERIDTPDAVSEWIDRFVSVIGYTGFVGFDFIMTADGRALAIECNPRATSGVHFIEPESLGRAMLEPEKVDCLNVRSEPILQQFYPTLIETQCAVLAPKRLLHHLKYLACARDVTWQVRDPWPFVLMTFTSLQMLSLAVRQGIGLGEAATRDIGYYHDDASNAMPTESPNLS